MGPGRFYIPPNVAKAYRRHPWMWTATVLSMAGMLAILRTPYSKMAVAPIWLLAGLLYWVLNWDRNHPLDDES